MKRFLSFMFIFFIYIGISLGQNTGSAIQFDGINDYVAIPEGLIQSTDHTYSVEVWINVNVLSNAWTGIVHHSAVGGEFILEIDPDNNFEFGVHTPTGGGFGTWYKTKSPATVNQWYHIVGVRDGTVMRIYVDGDLKDTLSIADADQFILPNYHSCIGAYNREGNYLNGQVDEVRFWNVALTQIQIQSNMNNLLAGTEEGLAAYWCFDEGSGTTTTDLTANGYIGTLMNDPTWVASTAPVIYPTINTPPAAPQNLTADPGDKQVILSWQANTESDFLRYRIYGGTSENPMTKIDSTTGGILDTVKTITNLVNGTTYYFRITAVDSAGNESDFSNEVNVIPEDIEPPLAPRSLTADPGNQQITLCWQANTESDFSCYYIYGDTTANPMTKIDSITSGILDTSKVLTGLTNNITYYFRITAVDTAGNESDFSNEISATPSFFSEQTDISLRGVSYSAVAWGDYDNDNDLDILLTGELYRSDTCISKIYRNDGINSFTEQGEISLMAVSGGSVAWGDYDNDSDLDILLTGRSATGFVSKIYQNNGNNSFTELIETNLIGVTGSSAVWGDYDNDGDLDIILSGNSGSTPVTKIYKNNGNNSFIDQTGIIIDGIAGCSVAWGDYDNDSDLDIIISGNSGSVNVTKIYKNNGNETFSEQGDIAIHGAEDSAVAWGDYNNDGNLDIVISGVIDFPNTIAKIYCNNGNNSFSEQTENNLSGFGSGSADWGDHDNDGNLDILFTGQNSGSIPESNIYYNNGDNSFTEQSDIILTGVCYSDADWGDFDNDGDLDILLSGTLCSEFVSKIYRNNNITSNSIPSAPFGLSASTNDSNVVFRWNKSSDNETPRNGLTYNLYIGTSPDSVQIMSPMANINTGFRRVVQMGNCNHDTCWTIKNLPAGTYYWSVQAIDNCFAGSAFAPRQTFVHNPVSINEEKSLPLKYALDPSYPNPFNPMTTIRYALPKAGYTQLSIYNLNGQLVEKLVDENKAPGYYSVRWNATRYSSGVYFYKLIAGDYVEIRKCVLIK